MKKNIFTVAASLLAGCVLFVSCMTAGTTGTTTTTKTSNTNSAITTGAAVASALLSQSGSNSQAANVANTALTALNNGSLISGVIGLLTGNATSATASIVGTWTYSEPTVQFESTNLLAQAGGALAGQTVIQKLAPYYQKIGLKAGSMKVTFKSDNTCSIVLGGKTISGTYTYNTSNCILNIKDATGLVNISGYATVSSNQLAVTLDSSKLLTFATALGAASNVSALSTISSLASSYSGMKTGFLFTR